MRRGLILTCVLVGSLGVVPTAGAATQTAHEGNVTATFTFRGSAPDYSAETLAITRGGATVYSQPVGSKFCVTICAPNPIGANHVHVLDLEHNGRPDVVLDLYSGGAHCCSIEQIFSFDPRTMAYAKTERNFGDPGERIADLRHNGRLQFVTVDDAFAYEFTDYAASGLPLQILTFSNRRFHNVTRRFPKLIARDAAVWLTAFNSMANDGYPDSVGVIAAWAADEDLLGHGKQVATFLSRQAKAGHLNGALAPIEPGGAKFVARLQKFLRGHGYLH